MHESILLLGLFGTAYVGFACLAFSQKRHWHELTGARSCPARVTYGLRAAGYFLITISLVLAVLRDGPSFGALLWGTMISFGAIGVAFMLRPLTRLLRTLMRVPSS
jgi:hypothetical protein